MWLSGGGRFVELVFQYRLQKVKPGEALAGSGGQEAEANTREEGQRFKKAVCAALPWIFAGLSLSNDHALLSSLQPEALPSAVYTAC